MVNLNTNLYEIDSELNGEVFKAIEDLQFNALNTLAMNMSVVVIRRIQQAIKNEASSFDIHNVTLQDLIVLFKGT